MYTKHISDRFIEFDDGTILDPKRITHVTPVNGDPAYKRYSVELVSGKSVNVYEDRKNGPQMKREKFIKKWKYTTAMYNN